jgi:hypothetical protein
MATFNMLAPAGGVYATRGGVQYKADSVGLITGVALGDVRDMIAQGCISLGSGTANDGSAFNTDASPPQVLAAAGATQGAAGVITKRRVIVTVTASTEGVILPVPTTGQEVAVVVPGTVGVKVYPHSNGKIDTSSTNAAITLVAGKGSIYMARDLTRWVTRAKGA